MPADFKHQLVEYVVAIFKEFSNYILTRIWCQLRPR